MPAGDPTHEEFANWARTAAVIIVRFETDSEEPQRYSATQIYQFLDALPTTQQSRCLEVGLDDIKWVLNKAQFRTAMKKIKPTIEYNRSSSADDIVEGSFKNGYQIRFTSTGNYKHMDAGNLAAATAEMGRIRQRILDSVHNIYTTTTPVSAKPLQMHPPPQLPILLQLSQSPPFPLPPLLPAWEGVQGLDNAQFLVMMEVDRGADSCRM
jgi:hypothetical protein